VDLLEAAVDLPDPGAAVRSNERSPRLRLRAGILLANQWAALHIGIAEIASMPLRPQTCFILVFGAYIHQGCASGDVQARGDGHEGGAGGMTGGGGISTTPGGSAIPPDPATCGEAASARSYVGCDFWPTVTFNPVWSAFDFAVVVANDSAMPAEVKVTRDQHVLRALVVSPGKLEKIYLPWVEALKGEDFRGCTEGGRPTASVRVDRGAYHLVSSVPVTVWQFNPIEYKAVGGPASKVWACPYPPALCNGNGRDCLSVSNDASLLLPTTAMTGHYRLFGKSGARSAGGEMNRDSAGSYAITATRDDTTVDVHVVKETRSGAIGDPSYPSGIVAGPGVAAASAGSTSTFSMNAGDVVQLLGTEGKWWDEKHFDLSGSLIAASHPVQVISTVPITNIPTPEVANQGYADHMEETVLPAESLGKHYLVAPPTTPNLVAVGHYVRFYGNVDGTTLDYPAGPPPAGAPSALAAGDVVEIGPVDISFEVRASQAFAIGSFMMGGQAQDATPGSAGARGDPAFMLEVTVEQFRQKYIFLAPDDYDVAVADIVVPDGASVRLDGAALTGRVESIGRSAWSVIRQALTPGDRRGVHTVQSNKPIGLKVAAFGHATGIYYPGGLNLKLIAPPPIVK
jgi:hypothetical protein